MLTQGLAKIYEGISASNKNNLARPSFKGRGTDVKVTDTTTRINGDYSPYITNLWRETEAKRLPVLDDRYTLISVIGEGAFSVTFEARDNFLNHEHAHSMVAVKVMKYGLHDIGRAECDRLWRINKSDPVDQCHVIRIISNFWADEGRHFCAVLELLQTTMHNITKGMSVPNGNFLRNIQNQQRPSLFNLKDIAKMTVQIVKCLQLLGKGTDDNKMIHGDLKPENILFKQTPKVIAKRPVVDVTEPEDYDRLNIFSSLNLKVTDFGNSSYCKDAKSYHNNFETLLFRAPEVLLGVPFNQSIDMWSVGCVVWELYTGGVSLLGNNVKGWFYGVKNRDQDLSRYIITADTLSSANEAVENVVQLIGQPPESLYRAGKYYHRYIPHFKQEGLFVVTSR